MNISKFKKDVLVQLCISVAGCAIWAGIVWGKDHLTGASVPRLGVFDVFQFVYIAVIAFVGYFFGKRSRNAELSEIYGDVILAWLKENCHTVCTFATEHMTTNVALPIEKISLGLQRLQKHELIVKKPLFWEYSAVSASNVSPGYGRLLGQETAARKRENGLQEVIATQEQTIRQLKTAYDPLHLSVPLSALPVYLDDLRVELLALKRGHTLDITETVFFLKLSLVCDEDTGIREMNVTITIDGRPLHGKPIDDDPSKWIVRTPFASDVYPHKTLKECPFNDCSLWKQLRQNGLKSGLVKEDWVGIRIRGFIPDAAVVSAVRLDITKPQRHESYRFRFAAPWPESEEVVYDLIYKLN